MTTQNSPSVVSQSVTSGNAPEVVTLRDAANEVPDTVSAYHVEKVSVTDQSSAQNDVAIQTYDQADGVVDDEVTIGLGADESKVEGGDGAGFVLRVVSSNQIRVDVEGDADVTLYLVAER